MHCSFFFFLTLALVLSAVVAQEVEVDTSHSTEENAGEPPLIRAAAIGDVATLLHELSMGKDINEANAKVRGYVVCGM
jgi:hypothetical protein